MLLTDAEFDELVRQHDHQPYALARAVEAAVLKRGVEKVVKIMARHRTPRSGARAYGTTAAACRGTCEAVIDALEGKWQP